MKEYLTVTKTSLDLIKFRIQKKISREFIKRLDVQTIENELEQSIVFEFQSKILGQENKQEYYVEYGIPLNWWQHLKWDLFPDWLEKIFPVKCFKITKVVTFNHMTLIPDLKLPEGQDNIIIYTPDPLQFGVYNKSNNHVHTNYQQ